MEDPALATHLPHNSKRRMYGGSSSSSSAFLDADVIEIPPPATWKSNRSKHNSTVRQEVIVVDDDDGDDVIILDEKIAPNSKGKKPMLNYSATNGKSSTNATIIGDDFDGIDLTGISYDDDCVMLQAHFDNLAVPTGIEVTVPWWPASSGNQSSSSSSFNMQPHSTIPTFMPYSQDLQANNHASKSSYFNTQLSYSGEFMNSGDIVYPAPQWPLPQYPGKIATSGPPYQFQPFKKYSKKWGSALQSSANVAAGLFSVNSSVSQFFLGNSQGFQDPSSSLDENISEQISIPSTSGQGDAIDNLLLNKLELFKKFDTLEDFSGHLYSKTSELAKHSKSWGIRIADEWRMLEKDLPDTIFVRVYESRMDLLRAVIVGADGTPYHYGLFFFDVNFTEAYPNAPPHVTYHAHGLRINPNLYDNGKVCLSLLGTWSGSGEENWRPGKSNMLQVLVSIQGLILNAEPYYNEPGYANSKNSSHGKSRSKNYSENTFLLSLKTMMYTLRNPPKYFEDLVFGHFYKHAHDILEESRAYLDGIEVGTFEKGKSQKKKRTMSALLKSSLPGYIKNLVEAFTKIGVKDCEKFLVPPDFGANDFAAAKPSVRKRRR